MLNFANANKLSAKNSGKRSGGKRGQSYDGFRLATRENGTSIFQFSNNMWDELGLDSNGFLPLQDPETKEIFLVVFPDTDKNSLFFKNSTKGAQKSKNTKADDLVKMLMEAGLVSTVDSSQVEPNKPVYQNLGFQLVDNPADAPDSIIATYKVVEDSDDEATEEATSVPEPQQIADEAPQSSADEFEGSSDLGDDLDV